MKSLLKQIICFILYYCGIAQIILRFLISKKKNLPVIIMIYHRIAENINKEINTELTINHPLAKFKREMRFLRRHFNIVSLDEAVEIIKKREYPNRPTLAVTFDDGFEDNYKLAFPVLKELNIPATIFLTAGLIGSDELSWEDKIGEAILQTKKKHLLLNSCFNGEIFSLKDIVAKRNAHSCITEKMKEIDYSLQVKITEEIIAQLGQPGKNHIRMLNWPEINEMSAHRITFGAHTMMHPVLSRMPLESAKKEIQESKQIIEQKIGQRVEHFAFPNGRREDFTLVLNDYCRHIGFKSVLTAVYGNNALGSDVYALKRLSPGRSMPIFAVDLIRGFLRNE